MSGFQFVADFKDFSEKVRRHDYEFGLTPNSSIEVALVLCHFEFAN